MANDSLARGAASANFAVSNNKLTDLEYDLRVGKISQAEHDFLLAKSSKIKSKTSD